jgi:hypothetical protein
VVYLDGKMHIWIFEMGSNTCNRSWKNVLLLETVSFLWNVNAWSLCKSFGWALSLTSMTKEQSELGMWNCLEHSCKLHKKCSLKSRIVKMWLYETLMLQLTNLIKVHTTLKVFPKGQRNGGCISNGHVGNIGGYMGRDSSVGIATGYRLDGPRIKSQWGHDFLHLPRLALELTQPSVQWLKWPGHDADHTPPSSAKVMLG